MEGIAGMHGSRDKVLIDRMLTVLHHRGPDRTSVYQDDTGVLGGRCSRSHPGPPIATREGLAVVSDSYLFNREFLRRTIVPDAEPDASDAELLLRIYRAIGTRMLGYIDGAFAIAILDGKRTILARDQYGIKPLYISSAKDRTVYSSEMKSQILCGSSFKPFPPGTFLSCGERPQKIVPREIPWANGPTPKTAEERLRSILTQSVSSSQSATGGFNVFLSGGIDSSVVAAAATQVTEKVKTVCVGTRESEDVRMARLVARELGTEHVEGVYDAEEMHEVLDEVIYWAESYDYPLIRSCVPNFMAARLFRDRNLVTLCGEGGDEIFAGYDFFHTVKDESELRRVRIELLQGGRSTGFQRVDRMTAAASLDGRMPLMSHEMIEFGLGLGMKDLLGPKGANSKYVLRRAYKDLLPKEIVWRRKRKFSDGAGSMNLMAAMAEKLVSDREFEMRGKLRGGKSVRTKEEMLYYEIFRRHFPSESAISSVGLTTRI